MSRALPGIDASAGAERRFWQAALAAAFAGLALVAFRIVTRTDVWAWWVPVAFAAGVLLADFGSGLVPWGADTWGRDDLPVIGPRLLVPFRVHHINPDDFLRRSFTDTNGDVALIAAAPILSLVLMPLDDVWQRVTAVGGFGLCAAGVLTNQIHQWAHMASPPRLVRLLQDAGVLLGRAEHAAHHDRPYDAHYCITTGWCNRPLERIGFFRGLERLITRLTGARPRHDDERYDERYGRGIAPVAAHD
jgi:ubiquitin-conjugating enzyme E2 variant